MPDPINMVTNLLLRLRPPTLGGGRGAARPSPPVETARPSQPLSLQMGGPEQSYRLRPSDAGWKSQVLMLPKQGLLKIGISLPGERVGVFHPVSVLSGTEPIPLPSSATAQGELWLVRQPEQQFLLLWIPFGIPPCPLNQLQLGLRASTAGASPYLNSPQKILVRHILRISILLFILGILLALI